MDNCMCQENNLIRGESPGLFKTWNNSQSFFHHLHLAGPAAARERTLQLRSDVAWWWFTIVEFKPIAAQCVSRRESSGSSGGTVTHGAGGDLCLGCSQRFCAFSQYRLFKAHGVKRGRNDVPASNKMTQTAEAPPSVADFRSRTKDVYWWGEWLQLYPCICILNTGLQQEVKVNFLLIWLENNGSPPW